MKPLIQFMFGVNQSFEHGSFIMAALEQLEKQNLLTLSFVKPSADEHFLIENPYVVCFKVYNKNDSKPLLFAVDTQDKSNVFDSLILNHCDFYLKKNFYHDSLTSISNELANKVKPYGLIYICRTAGSTHSLYMNMLKDIHHVRFSSLKNLYIHNCLPTITDFEQQPSTKVKPTIVFQTRVWEKEEAPGESEIINEQRVGVIRALKEAFGDQFRGGLVPNPLALSRYPNEVTKFSSRRRSYTAMYKQNLISIYTIGLSSSTAWKLAEYLAASQCIVAEQWRNELPTPLVNGKNYLSFETPDQCVAQCQKLLDSPELTSQMRQANYEFYKTEVAPSAALLNVLNRYADLSL